jgi:hypothetical protein
MNSSVFVGDREKPAESWRQCTDIVDEDVEPAELLVCSAQPAPLACTRRRRHPNDVIVRVTCAAICGSDLHLYHGMMPDLRVGHTLLGPGDAVLIQGFSGARGFSVVIAW